MRIDSKSYFRKFLLDITNDPRREEIMASSSGVDQADKEELEGKIERFRDEQRKYAEKEKATRHKCNYIEKIRSAVAEGKDVSGTLSYFITTKIKTFSRLLPKGYGKSYKVQLRCLPAGSGQAPRKKGISREKRQRGSKRTGFLGSPRSKEI